MLRRGVNHLLSELSSSSTQPRVQVLELGDAFSNEAKDDANDSSPLALAPGLPAGDGGGHQPPAPPPLASPAVDDELCTPASAGHPELTYR